jgi:CheY-like chemotaxis protein
MPPLAADLSTDAVDLLTGLAWPVVIGVVVWRLLPTIKRVISSRGFSINAGGMEISVQQASENLTDRLEDLREQFLALKAQVDAGAPAGTAEMAAVSPISEGLAGLSGLLWVDDYPENNAFEVESLRRKGVRVHQARSTADGLRFLDSQGDISAVITDMGRTEDGITKEEAGIELIVQVRERRQELPVLVYASAPAVARTRAKALEAGATFVTSSATELLEELGRTGMR